MDNAFEGNEITTVPMRVVSFVWENEKIRSFRLSTVDGSAVGDFTPGSHIELHLAQGLRRAYSIIRLTEDCTGYELGVLHVDGGRGGSRYIHERLRVGDIIEITPPRNFFPLTEGATHTVFLAGGIGITPFFSMIERLMQTQDSWEIYYCIRSLSTGAFLNRFDLDDDRIHLHIDELEGIIDIKSMVHKSTPGTHFYCCGPGGMLDAFIKATQHLDQECVHLESFLPAVVEEHDGFEVELARSGKRIPVRHDETILVALLNAGFDPPYSCQQGICGACELTVLEGVPDHKDEVLSEKERALNNKIMICCSSSKSPLIKLDF